MAPSWKQRAVKEIERRVNDDATYLTPLTCLDEDERERTLFEKDFAQKYYYPLTKQAFYKQNKQLSRYQKQLLQQNSVLKEKYESLVSLQKAVMDADFWERYEYRCGNVSRVVQELKQQYRATNSSQQSVTSSITQDSVDAKSMKSKGSGGGIGTSLRNLMSGNSKKNINATPTVPESTKKVQSAKSSSNQSKNSTNAVATTAPSSPTPKSTASTSKSIASTIPNTPDRSVVVVPTAANAHHLPYMDEDAVTTSTKLSTKEQAQGCWSCFNFCQ